jgi:cytochrome P450
VQQVDPAGAEAMAEPGVFYGRLGRECPVSKVDDPDFFIVSGYREIVGMLNDPVRWSKAEGNLLAPGETGLAPNQDPPEFADFRRIYKTHMGPKGVQRWAGHATRIARGLIDTLLPLKSGDLQELFAKPLPVRMTAIVLGLPQQDYDLYRQWTDAFLTTMASDLGQTLRVIDTLYAFFDEEFARRRERIHAAGVDVFSPELIGTVLPDDLISVLMTARFCGRPLTDDELRRTLRGFFIGGIDTTGALILSVLYRLLEDRSRWQAVAADPGLVDAAIEESLRLDPPTIGMFRGATCPIEIAGETVPADARAMFAIPNANRDPEIFADPDSFRLDWPNGERLRHIAFGSGAHFCPGAWIARSEARIALDILVRHLPDLRRAGPVKRLDPFNFWGFSSFPAAWD